MAKEKRLGKGLGAIFQSENLNNISDKDIIIDIKLTSIKENPYQPRKNFNDEKIIDLANSINENGLLQPIVVKPTVSGYYIVSGERRFRAFKHLNKDSIPAIVKEISDEDMMVLAVIENLQREDLSPLEEALSYKQLMDKFNFKQDELANQIGKSRPYVANSLRLLKLPLEIKEKLTEGLISAGHARTLLSLKTKKSMIDVCEKVIREDLSVRALEKYLAKLNDKKTSKPSVSKDIFIEDQEKKLKKILGTNVTIKQNKNKKGKIEIEFVDNEEFERIISLFME